MSIAEKIPSQWLGLLVAIIIPTGSTVFTYGKLSATMEVMQSDVRQLNRDMQTMREDVSALKEFKAQSQRDYPQNRGR